MQACMHCSRVLLPTLCTAIIIVNVLCRDVTKGSSAVSQSTYVAELMTYNVSSGVCHATLSYWVYVNWTNCSPCGNPILRTQVYHYPPLIGLVM